VEPAVLPLPVVDRLEQRRLVAEQRVAAAAAKKEPLPFEVRAVGEALRRYGSASASGARNSGSELADLRSAVASARARNADELLFRLLGVQTELFLSALKRWEEDGSPSTDLLELAGGFINAAQRNGWSRSPHRLVLTATERATLFRMRWTELTQLGNSRRFRPSLNEWRIYYRFLLEHPEGAPDSPAERARVQLAYVAALEKRDPDYPAALARGVLYSKLGAYNSAVQALETHLARYPNGVWRLRAQNYLAYALEQVAASPGTELSWH
jgi:hypothetical protein